VIHASGQLLSFVKPPMHVVRRVSTRNAIRAALNVTSLHVSPHRLIPSLSNIPRRYASFPGGQFPGMVNANAQPEKGAALKQYVGES
jgi:hypothetical protein